MTEVKVNTNTLKLEFLCHFIKAFCILFVTICFCACICVEFMTSDSKYTVTWVHDLQCQTYYKNTQKKVFKHFKNNYWTLITLSQSKKNKNFYCIHTLVMQVAYDIEPILPPPCYSLQMIYNHLQTPGSCLTDKWSIHPLRTSNTVYLKTTYRCCLYSLIFHCDCLFFLTDTASKITPKKENIPET